MKNPLPQHDPERNLTMDALKTDKVAPASMSRADLLTLGALALLGATTEAKASPVFIAKTAVESCPPVANPFTDPVENTDVSIVESELLLFLAGGPVTPHPPLGQERLDYVAAREAMNKRLVEWLRATGGLPLPRR